LERKTCRIRNDVRVVSRLSILFPDENFNSSMNIAGFSLSNWMTYGFSFASGSISWRFPIAFQLVFSFVLISTVPWLPESPRWLLAHGRHEEGIAILAALEGPNVTIKDEIIVNQRDEILDAVRIEQENAPTGRKS